MSYFGPLQIVNKKLVGKKLLYLAVNSSIKKWIDYEQLTDYLPEIIQYEKSQNMYPPKESLKQKFNDKKYLSKNQFQDDMQIKQSDIRYLEFIDVAGYDNLRRQKIILFKVHFTNGKSEFMTNNELKSLDMNALVKFYENQIKNTV